MTTPSPKIVDRCPSCNSAGTLFIGTGGYLTCSLLGCPQPSMGRAITALRKRLEAAEEKYNELLLAVANKHEDEDRHETALRYIRGTESRCSRPLTALVGEGKP